jgi:C7-cyclitol 7-kinase
MKHDQPILQALVFDLGGSNLRCGVWDSSGKIGSLHRVKIDNFLNGRGCSAVWNNLLSQITGYHESVAHMVPVEAPIIVSFPGPIRDNRRILSAPTFLGENTIIPDLVGELQERTGRRAYILNDISAAAWYLSVSTPVERCLVITISSGIGSKIFDRSHPAQVIDSPAWAGEIGHTVVDDRSEAPRCDCGGTGHLGAVASGRGIERAARRRASEDPGSFARSLCVTRLGATSTALNNEQHIVPAVLLGDTWCTEIVRQATRPLCLRQERPQESPETLRAECLDAHWFASPAEAVERIESWRREYNESRPHRALGERTPHEFARQIAASRDLSCSTTAGD